MVHSGIIDVNTRLVAEPVGGRTIVANLFGPASLPDSLDLMGHDLARIRDAVETLAAQAGQGDTPESELIVIPVSSAQLGAGAWYATSDQLVIVALDFWTNTNGRYQLVIENDTSFAFRANSNVKNRVVDPPGKIKVPRGLRIGVNSPGSTGNFTVPGGVSWDAVIYAYPGTVQGAQG